MPLQSFFTKKYCSNKKFCSKMDFRECRYNQECRCICVNKVLQKCSVCVRRNIELLHLPQYVVVKYSTPHSIWHLMFTNPKKRLNGILARKGSHTLLVSLKIPDVSYKMGAILGKQKI